MDPLQVIRFAGMNGAVWIAVADIHGAADTSDREVCSIITPNGDILVKSTAEAVSTMMLGLGRWYQ